MLNNAKTLNDLEIYRIAQELANWIFEIADSHFPPTDEHSAGDTIKAQVKAVEKHIAQSFHTRANEQSASHHTYEADSSLREVKNLMVQAKKMAWITNEVLEDFFAKHEDLKKRLDQQLAQLTK
jgi:four helix bundle protein